MGMVNFTKGLDEIKVLMRELDKEGLRRAKSVCMVREDNWEW